MDPAEKDVSGQTTSEAQRIERLFEHVRIADRLRSLRDALRAARQGDLSVRLPVDLDGSLAAEVAMEFNALVERNQALVLEIERIGRNARVDGKTAERASLGPVVGEWGVAIDSVNSLLDIAQWRTAAATRVLLDIADGDLSQMMPLEQGGQPLHGEALELGRAVNAVVRRLRDVSRAVSRIVREIGVDGKLGSHVEVHDLSGEWKDLVDNVNLLAGNLTAQVRNIALVASAIADGDLSQKITVETTGEILELKTAVNATVDQLRSFAAEVIRVAREVGTEGKLGTQADVRGVSGIWQELTDGVNRLAGNLTAQVRNIAVVATAIANGDLSRKITVEAEGEILELKSTINVMVDQLRAFAAEVTRVAKEVGTEGKLGAQADIKGIAGTWKDLTDNVNLLAGNLTSQVRNIALVTTAVANGDLSQKITVNASGEILELKNTINVMVDQLRAFAAEVTRVAREVGTEGNLGGQAQVLGVAGTWKDLTDNVNLMASNLTSQVRGLVKVVTAVANGDLSQKFVVEAKGEIAALADTINNMTDALRLFAEQVTTVAREVGIEGKLGGQAKVPGVAGTWRDVTDNVNMLAGNLTSQVRNIALVSTAIANGDLSQKSTVEARGEVFELKSTINTMVDRLRTFAAEVTRVAREVGTEGKLGGQAQVPGVAGTWQELTDSVNVMASNLTSQVRGIARVVTSVANGDLSQKLVLEARGEIATLADTINDMTGNLRTFADQVTTVAREVGIEGKLGGQAKVPGAAGTWWDLTDNVNQLAANLTTQVRAISEVASAVIQGDLSRTITVEARGEVLGLKDTINQMIANLRDTTRANEEQDWLKTNLAKFFGLMQGQRSLESLTQLIMSELTPVVGAKLGAFYLMDSSGPPELKLISTYAHTTRKRLANRFGLGESLVGQCALEGKPILVTEVPDDYVRIGSGLGEAAPRSIAVMPILFEGRVKGVIEVASFHELTPVQLNFLEQLMLNIGVAINLIGTSMRTEELLQQLQQSNVELEQRRSELEQKARALDVRNREVASASASVQEKAKELARVSQYKSQFLANMSHEVRTPLNSMMILAQMLIADDEKRLTPKQREYAETIHAAGRDLLTLINQILDLSKVEAGRIDIHVEKVALADVRDFVERMFRPSAHQKGLDFQVEIAPHAPRTCTTDRALLQEILKNLLANAFKFTRRGRVVLRIDRAAPGIAYKSEPLQGAAAVLALAVSDTGAGIPLNKQEIVFEAFHQADASVTRSYGGTGLGLTISRDYARVLGGEIGLSSIPGTGSTFTVYLPLAPEDVAVGDVTEERPREGAGEEALPSEEEGGVVLEDLAGKKILVVEDEVRNLYAVTSLLESHGMTVLPASTGREAIDVVRDHPDIDLVLMDIMLPEMDGYQATRAIRAMKERAKLPIIALTAKASESDRETSLRAGCDDYLVKPADARHLLSMLGRYLSHRRGRGE